MIKFITSIKNWFVDMKTKLIISGIAVVVVAGAFWWYGVTEYDRGVLDAQAGQKQATIDTLTDNNQIWKDVRHETSRITDYDAAGADLGILRPDAVR